jgi:hypothetical protein
MVPVKNVCAYVFACVLDILWEVEGGKEGSYLKLEMTNMLSQCRTECPPNFTWFIIL